MDDMEDMDDSLDLAAYDRVCFFTGAGISVESGVPTYRGAGGVWKEYDYQRYACQPAFERNPEEVWEFHNFRRELVGACAPNAGHRKIAELEAQHPHVSVVTQNIDGLHALAGSKRVHEVHGCLWRVRCDTCGVVQEGREQPLQELEHDCGAYWRPDIVWFGDSLQADVLEQAANEAFHANLLIAIGTSAVVYPAAQIPGIAKERGAKLIEINPEETPMSGIYHETWRGTASEMLSRLTYSKA